MYQRWLAPSVSIVTADRRNKRDRVVLSQKAFRERYPGIQDDSLEETTERGTPSFAAVRRITVKTIRALQKDLVTDGINLSIGTLLKLKPYYLGPPSLREQILCMCGFCLNTRQLFDAIRKSGVNDIGDSISGYLTKNFTCEKSTSNYHKLSCILGSCLNGCKVAGVLSDLSEVNSCQVVKYYQFERVDIPYINKKNEPAISKQIQRVDYAETLRVISEKLDILALKYLYHRYLVVNETTVWPRILTTASGDSPIFHLDYSENLQCTPKYEPQSHHFSGTQVILHCTVVHAGDDNSYVYHFADQFKKNHNATLLIIKDLVQTYHKSSSDTIRIRMDNCAVQYKCKSVFAGYRKLAMETKKPVMIYYGVPGHGKGLVDAMSGFGVKSPLRHLIQTEDYYYKSAESVCSKLKGMLRINHLVATSTLAKMR